MEDHTSKLSLKTDFSKLSSFLNASIHEIIAEPARFHKHLKKGSPQDNNNIVQKSQEYEAIRLLLEDFNPVNMQKPRLLTFSLEPSQISQSPCLVQS